jgi:hypothetical protein
VPPAITYTTAPRVTTAGNVLLVDVPERAVRALGEARRPPVTATVNGVTYRTTIAVYGGRSYLPARREIREAAKLEPGKRVTVRLELDTAPRTVAVPRDLAVALSADARAKTTFDGLAFSHRKEYVEWIDGAKREETRASRVAKTLAALRAGQKEARRGRSGVSRARARGPR